MSTTTPIFQMQHVSKSFGGVGALHDVQFDLHAGEVHALLGENGAGKSIMIMTGFHQPDQGTLVFEGQPVRFGSTRDAQAHGIAAIYQEPSLFPNLDIAENIFVGRQQHVHGGQNRRVHHCRRWHGAAWPTDALQQGQHQLLKDQG
jgi:rhamnose transport system ATP-binding protein